MKSAVIQTSLSIKNALNTLINKGANEKKINKLIDSASKKLAKKIMKINKDCIVQEPIINKKRVSSKKVIILKKPLSVKKVATPKKKNSKK